MNIYKVERTDRWSYDEYDSFVCYANTPDEARYLYPDDFYIWKDDACFFGYADGTLRREAGIHSSWVKDPSKDLVITYVGNVDMPGTKPEVILASYNAG